MRKPLGSTLLFCFFACAHGPVAAVDDPSSQPSNPAYEEAVRAALSERREQLRGCEVQARTQGSVTGPVASSPLYVSPLFTYFPRGARSRFLSAFENCLLGRLQSERLPSQVGHYSAAWVRIHFQPEGSPVPSTHRALYTHAGVRVSLEVSGRAPDRVNVAKPEPDTVPDPARDVFAFSDALTSPVLQSGNRISYTQEAFDHRVEGVMTVRCVLTWQGVLEDCRIIQPLPYVEREVLTSLASNRYTPITFEGQPVNVDYLFTIALRLAR